MIGIFNRPFFQIRLGDETYTVFPDKDTNDFSAIDDSGNSVTDPNILGNLFLHVGAIDLADRLLSQEIVSQQASSLQTLLDTILNLYITDASASALTQTVSAFTFTVYLSGGTAAVPLSTTLASVAASSAVSSAEAAANLGAPTILGLTAASSVQEAQKILSDFVTALSQGEVLNSSDIHNLINFTLAANAMFLGATQLASEDELLNRGFLGDLKQFGLDLIAPTLDVLKATGVINFVDNTFFEIAGKIGLAEKLAEILLIGPIVANDILNDLNEFYSRSQVDPYFSNENRLEAAIPFGLIVLQPFDGKDTYIRSSTSTSGDQGLDSDELRVGGWGDYYYSFLQFDLNDQPRNVDSAILRLYVFSSEIPPWTYPEMSLWTVEGEWFEGMQWPQNTTSATFVRDIGKPEGSGWFEIDITDIYTRWQSGALKNDGIQLRPLSNFANQTYIVSSESADAEHRPMLVINPVGDNADPNAVGDIFTAVEDTPLSGNVLADNSNGADSDPDGDPLSIQPGTFASANGGSVVLSADGSFTYTPGIGFSGIDSFDYTLRDGNGGHDVGIVSIEVAPANKVLSGGNGADILLGGKGNDQLSSGNGDDQLLGGDGNDTLSGGNGADILAGGAGDDDLSGGNGDDALNGDDGNDTLAGGNGDDILLGGGGDDQLEGGNGNDHLIGGGGDDTLGGGNGVDNLEGDAGTDTLTGGNGSDSFIFRSGFGNDTITDFRVAGSQHDVLRFEIGLFADEADLFAHSVDIADGILIASEAGDTLWIKNTTVAQLHAHPEDLHFV